MKADRRKARPRLVIISLYSYPLFRPAFESPFGGSEVRVSLIARGLAALGEFDVEVVVFDHNQPRTELIDGVTVRAWPGFACPIPARQPAALASGRAATKARLRKSGLADFVRKAMGQWRRGFKKPSAPDTLIAHIGPHPVVEKNVSFFRELDADIYAMPGNSTASAELATWCRIDGRPYVMLSGSDGDFHPDYLKCPDAVGIYGLPGYIMNATIESASAHVVQNERQAELLRASWHREAMIVRNPVDLSLVYPKADNPRDILWIGKSDWIKRPGLFLDLAERLPDHSFKMLLAFSNQQIWNETLERVKTLKNVTVVDFVPFDEVEKHFANAFLFVNSSVFEGFPNAFLQAGKYGIPIVSLAVDPGGMLAKKGCGAVCGDDFETLVSETAAFTRDTGRYTRTSETILNYVRTSHEKTMIARQYQDVLTRVLKQSRGGQDAQRTVAS